MKYRIPCVLVLCVLMLGSCGADKPLPSPEFFNQPFLMTAEYNIDGLTGVLSFQKNGVEDCVLIFLSPDTISGLTLTMQQGVMTTNFREITSEFEVGDLSRGSPIKVLYQLMSGTSPIKALDEEKNGDTVYQFEDGAQIVIYSGVPKEITIPTAGITLKVTGFEVLGGNPKSIEQPA